MRDRRPRGPQQPALRAIKPGKRRFRSTQATPRGVRPLARRLALPRIPPGRLVAIAAALGLVALLILLFVDDRFYVANGEITGLRFTSAGEIRRLAGVDDYSIFWVNGRQVAERLETLPFVKQATVRPVLPDTLRIRLVEREPVAVWTVAGERSWVDAEGVLLPVVDDLAGLPMLEDLDGGTVEGSGQVNGSLVGGLLELQAYLPDVHRFAYDRARGLHFTTAGGTRVVLGEPAGLAGRVAEFKALSAGLAGQAISEINLQNEGGFYYRPGP